LGPPSAERAAVIHPGRGSDATAVFIRRTQAYQQLRDKVRMVAAREASFGVLSTGEKVGVALVLNRPDLIADYGTILDAVDRLGSEWLTAAILLARDGWCE
jgi:hypothetical protein